MAGLLPRRPDGRAANRMRRHSRNSSNIPGLSNVDFEDVKDRDKRGHGQGDDGGTATSSGTENRGPPRGGGGLRGQAGRQPAAGRAWTLVRAARGVLRSHHGQPLAEDAGAREGDGTTIRRSSTAEDANREFSGP